MFILYLTQSLIQNQINLDYYWSFRYLVFAIFSSILLHLNSHWEDSYFYFVVPLNKVCLESRGWLRTAIWTSRSPEHDNLDIKHMKLAWYGICPYRSSVCHVDVSISIEGHHPFKQMYLVRLRELNSSTIN